MLGGSNVCKSTTSRLTTGLESNMGMQMPSPDVPACQIIADTDRLEEKELSDQVVMLDSPASSRRTMQELVPLWNVADLQQAQLEDSSIGPIAKWLKNSQDRPPKSDVAPYSDATKLYWAQWASLCL